VGTLPRQKSLTLQTKRLAKKAERMAWLVQQLVSLKTEESAMIGFAYLKAF